VLLMKKVLFLCTGNSCRSIMAEGLLAHLGKGHFHSFSAGSAPTGKVHPMSLQALRRHGLAAMGFESKAWDHFRDVDLDIVVTVCDNAAGETCPIFPGDPVKGHWSTPDPAHFQGTPKEVEAEFDRVFGILERRVKAMVELPLETLDRETLRRRLNEIGELV
jgi:arsenate reductase